MDGERDTLAPPSASHGGGSSRGGGGGAAGQSTRDAFNAALRSRNPQNNYIAHLKIWEPADDTGAGAAAAAAAAATLAPSTSSEPRRKARYLILAVQRDTGRVTINKAKRNANGSFSIGKDWDLNTLRAVDVAQPTAFTLTLSRPYSWTTDRAREQFLFLSSLINVYRRYTRNHSGPKCTGIDIDTQQAQARTAGGGDDAGGDAAQPPRPTIREPEQEAPDSQSQSHQPQSPPRLEEAQTHPPPRSASAEPPSLGRRPSLARSRTPTATHAAATPHDAFYDPRKQHLQHRPPTADAAVDGTPSPSSGLLGLPLSRRPTLSRNESAGPVLESTTDTPAISSLPTLRGAAHSPTPSYQGSDSTLTPANRIPPSSSKDKLSERLARVASGANSGRSTPTREASYDDPPPHQAPHTARPAAALSSRHDRIAAHTPPQTARPALGAFSMERRPSDASSSLSVPSSAGNARARLSAIEPVSARGGKAYERMLLAGTGLKRIGDEDEEGDEDDEDDDEDGNGNAVETMQDEEDIYAGMVPDDEQALSPAKRSKTLKASKSTSRKRRGDASARGATGDGSARPGNDDDDDDDDDDSDDDDATLVNVEELLEGIDFRAVHKDSGRLGLGGMASLSGGGGGAYSAAPGALVIRSKGQGTADAIEASLLSELEALDSANIHSILNGDDRLTSVLNHVDAALAQLDSIDSLVASFKLSLNSRAEDIGFIESQNRGLQVMNSNWRALEREIEQLRQTVNVPAEEVNRLLDPADFAAPGAIDAKEAAAASLYKAILQAKTSQMEEHSAAGGMAATTERLDEYAGISKSFGSTFFAHLSDLFSDLTAALLADPQRKAMLQPPKPRLGPHDGVEAALSGYCGLMLYLKEVEAKTFERISAAYLTSAAERYSTECSRLAGVWKMLVRKAADDEDAIASFLQDSSAGGGAGGGGGSGAGGGGPAGAAGAAINTLSRAATVRRLGGGGGGGAAGKKARGGGGEGGEINGSEAFNHLIVSLTPLLVSESLFLSDFLHLNSNGLTFADYMDLETYFRRRAAALFGEDTSERRGGLREMKGAMELVFGFVAGEVSSFIEEVERKDRFQVVGMVAALDAALGEAEEGAAGAGASAAANSEFLVRALHKMHVKVSASMDRFFADQLRAITLTAAAGGGASRSTGASYSYAATFRGKKTGRGGLTQAVRVLPHFVDRIESQLASAHHLGVRSAVDAYYTQLENTLIDALLSLRVEGANPGGNAAAGAAAAAAQDEDKGVMNHHVLLIENMHHLTAELGKLVAQGKAPVLRSLIARADKMYDESLSNYVHFVLRRPLGKMMDFADGIDALLRSTPANEVSLHSAYSKGSFRRLAKEYTSKDVRKQVDALWRRVLKHFDEDENEGFTLSGRGASASAGSESTGTGTGTELALGAAAEEEERRVVVGKVWRRCEADFVREVERLVRIQDECYKASGVTLEVRVDEVVRLFQR